MKINYIAFGLIAALMVTSVQAVQLGGAGHRNVTESEWNLSDDYIYLGWNKGQRKKVGVGIEEPEKDFQVVGDALFENIYIQNDAPLITMEAAGVVSGIISTSDGNLDIVAGEGYGLSLGSNNVYDRFILDVDGNVGIGVASVSSGLRLDVDGKVGASEYCDENGGNCMSMAEIAAGGSGGGSTVVAGSGGDCGLSAAFVAERGNVASNKTWSLGNGQSPYGAPMGCDGNVTKIAAMCSGNVGKSLDVYLYKNNVKTNCKVDMVKEKGKVVVGECDEKFVGTDVLNIGAGTESGSWSICVGTFWVKYEVEAVESTEPSSNNGRGNSRWW